MPIGLKLDPEDDLAALALCGGWALEATGSAFVSTDTQIMMSSSLRRTTAGMTVTVEILCCGERAPEV